MEKRSSPNLYAVIVLIFAGIAAVIVLATIAAGPGQSSYEIVKSVLIPLAGPIIAIIVPTMLFYRLPLVQSQQKTTIDLFSAFHTEEMRGARADAWDYFVIQCRKMSPADHEKRLDGYLDFLTERDVNLSVDKATLCEYQKLSRVLDFFNIVNSCLKRKAADPPMVRSFIGYYYSWWEDELLAHLRKRKRKGTGVGVRHELQWIKSFDELDAVCRSSAA